MDLNRRALLLSVLAGGVARSSAAQDPAPDPSLYIPKAHLVEERKFLHDFMEDFPFVDVITPLPTLRITHIPSLLDRGAGRYGTILGHISAQNPQKVTFDGTHHTVIVFRGPHGFISPSWYAKQDVVPTWNFGVVHALGRPRAVTDPAATRALLARLIKTFDSKVAGSTYDFSKLPDSYVTGMRGSFHANPATGTVTATRLIVGLAKSDVRAQIDVRFAMDPKLRLHVPEEMREEYLVPSGQRVEGTARYSQFKRFEVEASWKVRE